MTSEYRRSRPVVARPKRAHAVLRRRPGYVRRLDDRQPHARSRSMSSNAKPPSARELGLMVGQPAACRAVGHTLQLAGASLEPLGISARRAAHTVCAHQSRRRADPGAAPHALAGVLVDTGLLEPDGLLTDCVPEFRGSSFEGAPPSRQLIARTTQADAFEESRDPSWGPGSLAILGNALEGKEARLRSARQNRRRSSSPWRGRTP